jgi:hypothetical protein
MHGFDDLVPRSRGQQERVTATLRYGGGRYTLEDREASDGKRMFFIYEYGLVEYEPVEPGCIVSLLCSIHICSHWGIHKGQSKGG